MLKNITLAALATMTTDAVKDLAKEARRIATVAETATAANKDVLTSVGKVYHFLGTILGSLKSKNLLSKGTELKDWIKSVTGGKASPGGLACMGTFEALVVNGFLAEADYDKHEYPAIKTAGEIVDTVIEKGHDLSHDAIKRTCEVLVVAGKQTQKSLKAILDEVKGPKEITDEKADEMIADLLAAGHGGRMVATLGAENKPEYVEGFIVGIEVAAAQACPEHAADLLPKLETLVEMTGQRAAANVKTEYTPATPALQAA